ncbi:GTP-binding protein TypA [Candidatus Roizmanbacteria bacterium RIFCSPLOWO2_01_FULL_38_11]|uniref:50S ribosomal subunit assembly factor BipA n=1 Tax=Candidatus Roizmanbacteria bacterium RIFCSPLOWO2_01_FULL_38_11 TaxID=1802060 RepID=A0A1F7IPC3_9BACT|nr:MAG: GTP-binding protein TypA [Candidatus Roizmanbacteria bacterium RIFCSPLOWO2_01_FULL_38_11]
MQSIRNIAIIAHVDHGKTTLVDAMLKQTKSFRENQKEMFQDLIMDTGDLEKEKGITILAKNTSVFYNEHKINIIDTPGHADFGGEVERVLNMASGAILLVDAAEGPLPQTRFVLKKALENKLKIILIINKIDKKDARPRVIHAEVENLFLELANDETALDFRTLYAVGRDGKAFLELPDKYTGKEGTDLQPLFDVIIEEIPDVSSPIDEPFQMLISTFDSDLYVGKLCIGKVSRGRCSIGQSVSLVDDSGIKGTYKITKLFTSVGLKRDPVEMVTAGDIVAIAGIPQLMIGQTVTDPASPEPLPTIQVEEPTLKMTIGPNTSPFTGREGEFTTSRQIKERLMKEKEINLGLKIEPDVRATDFVVAGRGELHLSVLIETMRREGFEIQVSRPQVLYKTVDGVECEPFEEVTIDVNPDYVGAVNEEMGKRKAVMQSMHNEMNGTSRLVFKVASANLLGIRSILLTRTRGTAVMSSYFLGYEPRQHDGLDSARNGAIIATQPGTAMTYGLINAQDRGALFIGPATKVYEGMVVGLSNRPMDMGVNVCKEKKLTNNRSSGEGVSEALTPHTTLSLEECLDFLSDDELLEATPLSLRIRKQFLTEAERKVAKRKNES